MTHRIRARPPRGARQRPAIERDPAVLARVAEDAAHFPGGGAAGLARPSTEAEVADVVIASSAVLPIGAQSSLTGGATPMGEVVISTDRLAGIELTGAGAVRVGAGVPLVDLEQALAAAGASYPPVPTFAGALAGGVVATNAAGPATFKYGSTRDWVLGLTIVLASGDVLDLERGQAACSSDGFFEIETSRGTCRIRVPTYRMPDVPKRSAGYFAAPAMDLVDLFVGSEGTLGIVTAATFRVLANPPAVASFWVTLDDEATALELVGALRTASLETRRRRDPRGIDVSAIEHLDRRSLELLREEGTDSAQQVVLPAGAMLALLIQLDLPHGTTAEQAMLDIAAAAVPGAPDTPLARVCRLFDRFGLLDRMEVALPGDRRGADRLFRIREAVPAIVNARVARAKMALDARIHKTAADMIVPFDRFPMLMQRYRDAFERRGLDYAVWGHISDGNVHPNVIPRSLADVEAGRAAILELGRGVVELGGCPLAEHGVGRNPTKQALLEQLYGTRGIDEMRSVKRALDPENKLSPGVLFR